MGTSPTSWEAAARSCRGRGRGDLLGELRIAEVVKRDLVVAEGEERLSGVRVNLSFKVLREDEGVVVTEEDMPIIHAPRSFLGNDPYAVRRETAVSGEATADAAMQAGSSVRQDIQEKEEGGPCSKKIFISRHPDRLFAAGPRARPGIRHRNTYGSEKMVEQAECPYQGEWRGEGAARNSTSPTASSSWRDLPAVFAYDQEGVNLMAHPNARLIRPTASILSRTAERG
ncbi:MAG: hypothetical protein MZV70_51305, partial [Desulfobacterales bacterium]|nr:hypothetical protein [Desulfobacterales bacterium]